MKKSSASLIVIGAIIVIAIIVLVSRSSSLSRNTSGQDNQSNSSAGNSSQTVAAPVTENTKVSNKTSQYKNAELGFSVDYPTAWEADSNDSGVTFVIPVDQTQVSTIATLQGIVKVNSGKCAFPPVTSVKDRGTISVGDKTLNTISMSNNVQGRSYFYRMYSLDNGGVCYMFTYSSIALSPSVKGLTGSNLTQAQNNNKAITNTADADIATVVKSFAFVTGPQGQDESTAAPTR